MYNGAGTDTLDFNSLLQLADVDPAQTLIVRHAPVEKQLKRVLPWLVAERPDLWLAYQRIQWESLEKAMKKAKYIASFIGQETRLATFAGFYSIGTALKLDLEGYRSFPGNSELEALGMSGRSPEMGGCLAFELVELPFHPDWIGRLVIEWPKPYQQWWRWGGRGAIPVSSIDPESRFVTQVPDWADMVFAWSELKTLPQTWQAALAQWRGIYYIFDTARSAGYVGSAAGTENILGRWLAYARTGHGGNRELKESNPEDLQFSILERTSPDLDPVKIVALESSWKARLHTRTCGLNSN